jgi:hypothetical protein
MGEQKMIDPVFLARVLAASVVAMFLALCASNARDSSENTPHQAASSISASR